MSRPTSIIFLLFCLLLRTQGCCTFNDNDNTYTASDGCYLQSNGTCQVCNDTRCLQCEKNEQEGSTCLQCKSPYDLNLYNQCLICNLSYEGNNCTREDTPLCSQTEDGLCVTCEDNSQCQQQSSFDFCQAGLCVQCLDDVHCPTQQCFSNHTCKAECTYDYDCYDHQYQYCQHGQCQPCDSDEFCIKATSNMSNLCLAGNCQQCISDKDCVDMNYMNPYYYGDEKYCREGGFCSECRFDEDCSYRCGDTYCQSICFHKSTEIFVERNSIWERDNLENVEAGEWILTFDYETGQLKKELMLVKFNYYSDELSTLIEFHLEGKQGQTLKVTDEHYVFVLRNSSSKLLHIPAKEVLIGDSMVDLDLKTEQNDNLVATQHLRKVLKIESSLVTKKDVIGVSTGSYTMIGSGVHVSCQVETGAGQDFVWVLDLIGNYISPTLPQLLHEWELYFDLSRRYKNFKGMFQNLTD